MSAAIKTRSIKKDGSNKWMLTMQEYLDSINSNPKNHDSSAYDNKFTLCNLNRSSCTKTHLVSQFISHGIQFSIHSNGNKNEFVAIDTEADRIVGTSNDEWGCVLIGVAKEYRGLGIGKKLSEITRDHLPFKEAGGFTPLGKLSAKSVFRKCVSRALSQGKFRKAYKSGELTFSEIKNILSSCYLTKESVIDHNKNLESQGICRQRYSFLYEEKAKYNVLKKEDCDLSLSGEHLVLAENNTITLYDRSIYKIYEACRKNDRLSDHFLSEAISGYSYLGGSYHESDNKPKLFRKYYKNNDIKKRVLQLTLSSVPIGSSLLICNTDIEDIRNVAGPIDAFDSKTGFQNEIIIQETPHSEELRREAVIERMIRRQVDPFSEVVSQIREIAFSLGEDDLDKTLSIKEEAPSP